MISRKVILTGSFGVGKTSLFNQFIFSQFNDKYLTTIGVKVNKKVVAVEGREISILLWDIAGEVSQDKVPHSYFLGASGVIYVFDLSRPLTFENIRSDIGFLRKMLPDVCIRIVGNKKDLVSEEQIAAIRSQVDQSWNILTSAKTGENVEYLFEDLARELLSDQP